MTTKADIQEFISQEKIALVGVSRTEGKFSNAAYKELKTKGYKVFGGNSAAGGGRRRAGVCQTWAGSRSDQGLRGSRHPAGLATAGCAVR